MIKVGMILAERYEIIEKIGTGGMSDVYRAKDHKLNRYVAVKLLKQEFSENTDFVSKFRVEAQAAAGLMHANIVNVYDVGEENGNHYIVMELVEGITLKKYIEKKARLSFREAVSIGIQVSMGIEAAHNNHIIHRDIKPQNIIISKEGKVKVTDFGIAKAATSNTITSNVMGSVHYTSPEQVRGGFSDEKSDIYSLGITIFEMLTGRVPFNGETTVAVAIKHIQEAMPSPRNFVSEIPVSVEQIVLKCTQKSPDKRYQSVPELIEDLKKSLISPDENFVKIDTNEAVGGATKTISGEQLRKIKESRHHSDTDRINKKNENAAKEESNNVSGNTARIRQTYYDEGEATNEMDYADNTSDYDEVYKDDYAENYEDEYAEHYEEQYVEKRVPKSEKKNSNNSNKNKSKSKNSNKNSSSVNKKKNGSKSKAGEDYDPKMEFLTTVLVVVAAIVIGCIFLFIVAKVVSNGIFENNGRGETLEDRQQIEMVNVIGLDAESAKKTLSEIGLLSSVEFVESAEEANTVLSTSVSAGTAVPVGTTVVLQVSSGANGSATIPSVVGLSKAEATAKLEQDGFVVNVVMVNSDTVEKNNVISQSPEGNTSGVRGATVELQVSLGAEVIEVVMPDVMGKSEEEAIVILAENGLSVMEDGITEEYSDTVPAGYVCYQSYSSGLRINSGTEVKLKISAGPEQVFYNCSTTVSAPNDYAGGAATVVLKGSDGTQLFATSTDSFPVSINVSNIFAMANGEIYVTYNVNKQQEVTDAEGNVTLQNVSEQTTQGPIPVAFTKAQ